MFTRRRRGGVSIDNIAHALRVLVDRTGILPAQTVKPNKIASISTAIVGCEATFSDMVQSLLRYVWPSGEYYGVCFVNVHILDIVDDIIDYNFWSVSSGATYVRYIKVDKMPMKNQGVIPLFRSLGKDTLVAKTYGNTSPHFQARH